MKSTKHFKNKNEFSPKKAISLSLIIGSFTKTTVNECIVIEKILLYYKKIIQIDLNTKMNTKRLENILT